MLSRRASAVGLAVLAVLLPMLAGCESGRSVDAMSSVSTLSTADCRDPRVLGLLGMALDASITRSASTLGTSARARAEGSTAGAPAAAVLCSPSGVVVDSAGAWAAVRSVRVDGDLAALARLLDDGCPAATDGSGVVVWWLDALDRAALAAVPQGGCDAEAVAAALVGLEVSDEAEDPVQRVGPVASPAASP